MPRMRFAIVAAALLALAACSTTPPGTVVVPPPAQPAIVLPAARDPAALELKQKIAQANAVYLSKVERREGLVHYVVTEVWRHDANLGRTPPIGSEVMTPRPEGQNTPRDSVLIFKSAGNSHAGVSTATTPVTDGYLDVGHMPLSELREAVATTEPRVPVPHSGRLGLDDVLARSHGIYLVRVEPADGKRRYILSEVWRHDPRMGPEPPHDAELFSQPDRAPGVSNVAVVFVYSADPFSPGEVQPNRITGVFNGFVTALNLSLDELRAYVAAHPAP